MGPTGDVSFFIEDKRYLRFPLLGFSSTDTSGQPINCSIGNGTGYCDSSYYESVSSENSFSNNSGHPIFDVNGVSVSCSFDDIIADTTCIETLNNNPPSPWRNGQGSSDYLCLKIDSTMFTTDTGSEWDYKIRVVIFNNCSGSGSSDSGWSLAINCLGCNCNSDFCGGEDDVQISSFSAGSSSSSPSSSSVSPEIVVENVTLLKSGSNENLTLSYPSRTNSNTSILIARAGVFKYFS